MYAKKLAVAGLMAMSVLSGCSIYEQQELTVQTSNATMERLEELTRQQPRWRSGEVIETPYVPVMTREELRKPGWWTKSRSIGYSDTPFAVVLGQVLSDEYVTISTEDLTDVDMKKAISVESRSTIGAALQAIADASGYYFDVSGNTVVWKKFEDATFELQSLPGVAEWALGAGQDQNISSFGFDATIQSAASAAGSGEYTKQTGEFDLSTEMQEALKIYMSDEGSHTFVQSTGTLVVRDYPQNIRAIERLIADTNSKLTRQALLQIEIIDVTRTGSSNWSVDMNLLAQELGSKNYGISSAGQFGNNTFSDESFLLDLSVGDGRFAESQLLIQALAKQGTVTSYQTPRTLLMNNLISKLRDLGKRNFILEQTITNTINVGTQGAIRQGTVETGLSLYALANIFEDELLLRITTNLSTLLSLDKKGDAEKTGVTVEAPNLTDKSFDQVAMIPSGHTLIIAGLQRNDSSSNYRDAGTVALGGGQTTETTVTETIIAITPVIQRGRRG